jgi:shikimate kinase
MKIVLTGMKHCGKSTVGRLLAKRWSCPFADTDAMLEELFEQNYGEKLDCRGIFRQYGEEFFRNLEAEVIERLRNGRPMKSRVIALGGGLPMNSAVSALLPELGHIVYLKVAPEVIFKRIEANGLPPYLDAARPFDSFMEFYREREKVYENIAELTVAPENMPPEETAAAAAQTIESEIRK